MTTDDTRDLSNRVDMLVSRVDELASTVVDIMCAMRYLIAIVETTRTKIDNDTHPRDQYTPHDRNVNRPNYGHQPARTGDHTMRRRR